MAEKKILLDFAVSAVWSNDPNLLHWWLMTGMLKLLSGGLCTLHSGFLGHTFTTVKNSRKIVQFCKSVPYAPSQRSSTYYTSGFQPKFHQYSPEVPQVYNLELGLSKLVS